ncbi:MAG: PsiF family protein [Hyphomicrobium sp.]
MSIRSILAAATLALVAGAAQAQTPAPAAAPQATAPPTVAAVPAVPAKTKAERTPESLKCSADADVQGLHGAARKTFRKKCMSDAKKAATATGKS